MCHEVAIRVIAAGGTSVFINTGPRPEYPAPYAAYAKAGFEAVERATRYTIASNITLGGNVPANLIQRIGAQSMRIYVTAQDPYVHSSYAGQDPEVGGAAPTIRTMLIGTNIVW